MIKSKTEQLQKLFKRWKDEQNNEFDDSIAKTKINSERITKKHFCEDGIIDEDIFEKEKIKVLFITNEPNAEKYTDKETPDSSRITDFQDYYESGSEKGWKGRIRERVCVLYKTIIGDNTLPVHNVANRFAFMNLNKRGGDNKVKQGIIKGYVDAYKTNIKCEIEIIDPDIIVWLGYKTYPLYQCLDAISENEKVYFILNGRKVPVLKMKHPSGAHFWKDEPIMFQNKIHGKLAAAMKAELERYGIK